VGRDWLRRDAANLDLLNMCNYQEKESLNYVHKSVTLKLKIETISAKQALDKNSLINCW